MSRNFVHSQPHYGDAKCMKCKYLQNTRDVSTETNYMDKHYGVCGFPLPKIPAGMILNGVRDIENNRLIPRLELFGYQLNTHLNYCAQYSSGPNQFDKIDKYKKEKEKDKSAVVPDKDLAELMKPFKLGGSHVG